MKSDLAPPSLRWTHKDNDTPISIKCRKYSGFQAAVNFAKYSFMDYHYVDYPFSVNPSL